MKCSYCQQAIIRNLTVKELLFPFLLESSELLFNIQGVNNTGVNLKDIVGAIVLLKDNLVVGQTYFNTGNVATGAQFNASYKFPAEVHGNKITPLEFDEAFVYLINAN